MEVDDPDCEGNTFVCDGITSQSNNEEDVINQEKSNSCSDESPTIENPEHSSKQLELVHTFQTSDNVLSTLKNPEDTFKTPNEISFRFNKQQKSLKDHKELVVCTEDLLNKSVDESNSNGSSTIINPEDTFKSPEIKSFTPEDTFKCQDESVFKKPEFKKPNFIGSMPKFGKNISAGKVNTSTNNAKIEILIGVRKESEIKEEDKSNISINKSPAQHIVDKNVPIPYKEPPWSGLPSADYYLEVIKTGVILEHIPLQKPFIVIGRSAQCDIVMEHPSISRFHCILQYRMEVSAEQSVGYYIYDLGSTHGSFLNKMQLQSRVYQRIQVGHLLKFGGSSRMFILQGPEEDQEPQSELTVTELKQQATERANKLERLENDEMDSVSNEEEKKSGDSKNAKEEENSTGVSWGMSEDAVEDKEECEDDETLDKATNPFASSKHELYLDDPKKTLRGWFEREGHDLPNYQVEDISAAKFKVRLEIPVESVGGKNLIVEFDHAGKKKDAVVQCALEACRMLDRRGILRQARHDSHIKKKKNWSENDYYDSDEDDYLDRTGDIQKKRKKRMKEDDSNDTIQTYESLLKQYNIIVSELLILERRLVGVERLKEQQRDIKEERQFAPQNEVDDLDAFMVRLKAQVPDVHKRVAWKLRTVELKKEELQLRKLVNVARPAGIDEIHSYDTKTSDVNVNPSDSPSGSGNVDYKKSTNKSSLSLSLSKKRDMPKSSHLNSARILGVHKAFIEDEPEIKPKLSRLTDGDNVKPIPYSSKVLIPINESNDTQWNNIKKEKTLHQLETDIYKPNLNNDFRLFKNVPPPEQITKVTSTELIKSDPIDIGSIPSSSLPTKPTKIEEEEDNDAPIVEINSSNKSTDVSNTTIEQVPKKLRILGPCLGPADVKKTSLKISESGPKKKFAKSAYNSDVSKYETWTPPVNQSGDGRTHLNDKFGY